MRGRSYSENAFCSWRRSIAPGACRCQPVRRSFFDLNQEAHAQREPRCRDVIRWSKCSEIGRASCRERVSQYVEIPVVAGTLKQKHIITILIRKNKKQKQK